MLTVLQKLSVLFFDRIYRIIRIIFNNHCKERDEGEMLIYLERCKMARRSLFNRGAMSYELSASKLDLPG
jgi:hypothetical protein